MEVVIIERKAFDKIISDVLALARKIDMLCAKDEGKYEGAWLDNEDVCRRLQISPRRLQTLRKFSYRVEDIEAFLQAHKQEVHKI